MVVVFHPFLRKYILCSQHYYPDSPDTSGFCFHSKPYATASQDSESFVFDGHPHLQLSRGKEEGDLQL